MAATAVLEVMPTGAALGAEIRGVDLRVIDDAAFARHLSARGSITPSSCVRDQQLSDAGPDCRSAAASAHSIRRRSRRTAAASSTDVRRSTSSRTSVENGVAIGSLGAGEAVWHTDMSYLPDPPKASALYALEVPPSGGDTSFCTMYGAWECASRGLCARPR